MQEQYLKEQMQTSKSKFLSISFLTGSMIASFISLVLKGESTATIFFGFTVPSLVGIVMSFLSYQKYKKDKKHYEEVKKRNDELAAMCPYKIGPDGEVEY